MFQDLLTRNKDVKRRRCKANIHNKLCYNFTKITINEYPLQSERSPFSECVNQPSPQPSSIGEGEEKNNPFSLWEREQLCEQVEHTTAGEGANRCQDVQKSGVQADVHKILKQVQDDMNICLKRTYSHINLFTYSPRKRVAFTLAEILITLGIIGVVAAMTMPSLIADYKNKEFAVRAKRTYSVISQAIKLYEAENGTPGDVTGLFDTSKTSKEVLTNFSKYFDGAKLCLTPSKDCKLYAHNVLWASPLYDENSSAFADGSFNYYPTIMLKDGSMILLIQYSSCTRTETAKQFDSDGKVVVDNDGNPVTYTITYNYCADIAFDTNGNSRPNQYGADVFQLRVNENGKFTTGWDKTGWASLKNILGGGDPIYTRYTEGQKKD